MYCLITLFLLNLTSLMASENVSDLHFYLFKDQDYTKSFDGKKVQIRGFLYPLQDDRWVLSPEPHLKTCCVGSKEKTDQQIFLHGAFKPLSNDMVTLEGVFEIHPNIDEIYVLKNPTLIESQKKFTGALFIGLSLLFLALWLVYKKL